MNYGLIRSIRKKRKDRAQIEAQTLAHTRSLSSLHPQLGQTHMPLNHPGRPFILFFPPLFLSLLWAGPASLLQPVFSLK